MSLYIKITNDGTGDEKIGFYDYTVSINEKIIEEGRIEWYSRADGWLSLVQRMVHASIDNLRL